MYKRFLALFLAMAMAFALTACTPQEEESNPDQDASQTGPDQPDEDEGQPETDPDSAPDSGDAPSSDTPADDDTPPPADGGQDSGEPSAPSDSAQSKPTQPQEPAETPDQQPQEQPEPKPDEPPAEDDSFTIDDIWAEIQSSLGDSLPSLSAMDADTLTTLYPLSTGDLAEYGLYLSPMGVQATEIFIAKAASGKAETVKSAITSRQADLVAQWENYLPAQLELVQNYKLVTNGDYILFCVAEKAGDVVDIFNSFTK